MAMAPLVPGLVFFIALASAYAEPGPAPLVAPQESEALKIEEALQKLDPAEASLFLENKPLLSYLKAKDPDRLARMMLRATQLKDLSDVLRTHDSAGNLHEALRLRLDDDDSNPDAPIRLGFGSQPSRLVDWARDRLSFPPTDLYRVRAAVLEWDTLPHRAQAEMAARPVTPEAWASLSFLKRSDALSQWGRAIYQNLLQRNPRNLAHLAQMQTESAQIWDVLSNSEKFLLDERITRAALAVDQLKDLSTDSRVLADPKLKALLEEAGRAGTLEASLSLISTMFDKLGVRKPSVDVGRPPRDDEKFADKDRGLLASLLAAQFLKSISGTDPGRRILALYKRERLVLKVKEMLFNLAEFDPETNELAFNERYIMEWLQSTRRVPKDLVVPEVLEELAMLLEPTFIHEAVHHEQAVWARERGLSDNYSQLQEVESKALEALHIIQKARADPRYKKFLEENQHLLLVREYAALSGSLESDPRGFPRRISANYYPFVTSLEGSTADYLGWHESLIAAVRAEEKRRAGLSKRERQALFGSSAAFPAMDKRGNDAWVLALSQASPRALAAELAAIIRERDKIVATYAPARDRYYGIMDQVEQALSAPAASEEKHSGKSGPPSPGDNP